METNLSGRLRNTNLPASHGLLPLFEAVVNSIHAIEEANLSARDGKITVQILRDTQQSLPLNVTPRKPGPEACEDIIGFKVTDNGIGFNEANMKSFSTLDSDYKASKGARGVGRLAWLKAFERANVCSVFRNEKGKNQSRSFTFSEAGGVGDDKVSDVAHNISRQTTVHLDGFVRKYREASKRTTAAIASALFEHCLWYFVRGGGAPNITVQDESDHFDLLDVYDDHMVGSAVIEDTLIKQWPFCLTHIRLRAKSSQFHAVALCAANRLVKVESITGKIPGLYGPLHDDKGEFTYYCYVSS
ncbi:MAG: hypothetical protein ABIE70_11940 [bacterium]